MFASASPDNIKQWKCPEGKFIQNLSGHNAILNCLAINADNVMVSGADNGSLHFWDFKTGYNFQRTQVYYYRLDNFDCSFILTLYICKRLRYNLVRWTVKQEFSLWHSTTVALASSRPKQIKRSRSTKKTTKPTKRLTPSTGNPICWNGVAISPQFPVLYLNTTWFLNESFSFLCNFILEKVCWEKMHQ